MNSLLPVISGYLFPFLILCDFTLSMKFHHVDDPDLHLNHAEFVLWHRVGSDVKRGQIFEAKAEAEDKSLRTRTRTRTNLRGRVQSFEAEDKFEAR